ncbi:cell division protein FtsQ/DivIB [Saccharospirillum sp. HFRX-1]|uniref:cell division protein FtsQ/DivIB n=1 Tax=unclassified Saccharospirillum TaxID=2633430 RepID=UPI0037124A38
MNDARKRKQGATLRKSPLNWRKPLRYGLRALAGGVVLALLITAGRWVLGLEVNWQPLALNNWALDEVLVYQSRADLDDTLAQYQGRSLLLISPEAVRKDVEALPWVSQALVSKVWPDQLQIHIEEHQPVARWNGEQVLNSDGEPLSRPVADLVLADLRGPSGQAKRVMDQYLQYSRVFVDSGVRLAGVRMHPRGAWDLQLDNGIQVALGSSDMLDRTTRVVALLERRPLELNDIEYIDARYPNGVAVGRRADNEPSA